MFANSSLSRLSALLGSLLLAGCSGQQVATIGYVPADPPMSFPVSEVVKDERPVFQLDADKPWRLEFGRGSGWHGLDTVKLDQDGQLVLHRLNLSGDGSLLSCETASLEVSADVVAKILEAVKENRLLELEKEYHAAVVDGTQWVLWFRQGDLEKSVYFNNHFPDPVLQFSSQLDEILAAAAGPNLTWQTVDPAEARQHERELWDSIKR